MYVVFKTHFDLGFTDTAENVSQDYLTNFIPQAIKLSKEIPEKFDQKQSSINDGLYILLQNNIWGTNFRDWFEDDMTYPFSATFDMRKPYSDDLRTKVHI